MSYDQISAIFEAPTKCDGGTKERVASWLVQGIQQIMPPGQNVLPIFSLKELKEKQESNHTLSRVLFYLCRGRRLSWCERSKETCKALKMLKQWERLKLLDVILYWACKVSLTKSTCYQFDVPDSLVSQVMCGIHNESDHQGQGRTLFLAR